jgi:hypothetical protein
MAEMSTRQPIADINGKEKRKRKGILRYRKQTVREIRAYRKKQEKHMNRMDRIRNYIPLQQKQDEGQVDEGGNTVRLIQATNLLTKVQ